MQRIFRVHQTARGAKLSQRLPHLRRRLGERGKPVEQSTEAIGSSLRAVRRLLCDRLTWKHHRTGSTGRARPNSGQKSPSRDAKSVGFPGTCFMRIPHVTSSFATRLLRWFRALPTTNTMSFTRDATGLSLGYTLVSGRVDVLHHRGRS
jgi:hypothetical protein